MRNVSLPASSFEPAIPIPRIVAALLWVLVLFPSVAHAKRTAPPSVQPVVRGGMRYVAPNDNGRRGYIQAWDVKTNRMLWEVTVYRVSVNPFKEADVQWVFIREMRADDDRLIVIDERERAYAVDLKTRDVRRLKQAPPTSNKARWD